MLPCGCTAENSRLTQKTILQMLPRIEEDMIPTSCGTIGIPCQALSRLQSIM